MRCYCERPLIMSQSRSKKNPGRLFFKCPKCNCKFFQWVDQEPRGIAKAWMEGSRIQEGYPGPQELFIPQQRDSDMKKVEIRERKEKRQERERQYTEKLRNMGILMNENENACISRKKKNGTTMINDIMEMRRWGLAGPFEGNWI